MPSRVQGHGWSTWPTSIKLLLAGILILVAFGLYRRCTEDRATRRAGQGNPSSQAAPAQLPNRG